MLILCIIITFKLFSLLNFPFSARFYGVGHHLHLSFSIKNDKYCVISCEALTTAPNGWHFLKSFSSLTHLMLTKIYKCLYRNAFISLPNFGRVATFDFIHQSFAKLKCNCRGFLLQIFMTALHRTYCL